MKATGSSLIDAALTGVMEYTTGRLPPGTFVEARCLRVDAPEWRYELGHCWPMGISMFVGDHRVLLKKPDAEHDEAPDPFDLSLHCVRTPLQRNAAPLRLSVAITAKKGETWALGVVFGSPAPMDQIVQEVMARQKPAKERLREDEERIRLWVTEHRPDRVQRKDALRCVEPPVINLRCSMSLMRISIPARTAHCDHLQCFDLEAFVHTMKNIPAKRAWCCPICDKPAAVHQIQVDEFAQNVLDKTDDNVTEVLVADNGKWEVSATEEAASEDESSEEEQRRPTRESLQEQALNLGRVTAQPAAQRQPPPPQPPPEPPRARSRSPRRGPGGQGPAGRGPAGKPGRGPGLPSPEPEEETAEDKKMQAWEKLQGIQRPKKIVAEKRIGWLPEGVKCSRCMKSVMDKGGVYCGRQPPGQEARGCFEAICWKCMNKAGKDDIGSIRTSKGEFSSLGPLAWWMHEKCMNESDKKLYYGESDDEAEQGAKDAADDDGEEDGPDKFAWE